MDLTATKGAVNARLVPLVDRLAAAGVTPDRVTLAAVPVAVFAGACLLASSPVPLLLLAVPLLGALGLLLFTPALVPAVGVRFVLALVPFGAGGALWGAG